MIYIVEIETIGALNTLLDFQANRYYIDDYGTDHNRYIYQIKSRSIPNWFYGSMADARQFNLWNTKVYLVVIYTISPSRFMIVTSGEICRFVKGKIKDYILDTYNDKPKLIMTSEEAIQFVDKKIKQKYDRFIIENKIEIEPNLRAITRADITYRKIIDLYNNNTNESALPPFNTNIDQVDGKSSEGAYNRRVSEQLNYELFDRRCRNGIEICDLYNRPENKYIHVKKASQDLGKQLPNAIAFLASDNSRECREEFKLHDIESAKYSYAVIMDKPKISLKDELSLGFAVYLAQNIIPNVDVKIEKIRVI